MSASFEFIGAHWRPLGRCLLYFVVPVALVMGLLLGIAQNDNMRLLGRSDVPPAEQLSEIGSFGPTYWLALLVMLISYASLAATVYGYVRARMDTPPDQEVTPQQVGEQLRLLVPRLTLSGLAVVLVVIVGMVLLLVPGIYLSVALSMVWAIQVFENQGIGSSFSRNINLVRGKWWSTLGLSFVMSIVIGLIGLVLQIPQYIIMAGKVLHWEWLGSEVLTVAVTVVASVGQMILYTPLLVALMFQYFNLVERKEGVGMRHLVDSLGSGAPPMAYNNTYRPDDDGEY